MKTHVYFTNSLRLIMVFTLVLFLGSCQKTEKMQTFNDIFNTSGIDEFNSILSVAKTVADMPAEFGTAKFTVPEGIKNITSEQIAAWYSKNIKLSNAEVDLLLKNDSKTYIDVINRMASFPPEIGKIKASDFAELKASPLNKYLLRQIDEPDNFYSTDYYSAVVAMQEFIKKAVIAPMGDTNSPGHDDEYHGIVLFYKIISLNNIWDMWWTYWSDGTRTKHKGAAGTFPG